MGLVSVILVMTVIFITFIVGLICFFTIEGIGKSKGESYDTVGPLIVCCLIAIVVTSLFNLIFSVTSDTLLHCYIYEEEHPEES